MVGTSGNSGIGRADDTASGTTVPARIWPSAELQVTEPILTWPATRSVIACPAPL
jgi:hypothetical protein